MAQQLDPYRSTDANRVVVTGEAIALRPAAALSLNLVLHELTTNAVKYGGLSVPAGRVEVSWRLDGSADARRLVLAWREAGGPEARPPDRRGFGCQLIERSIAHALGGEVELEFLAQGVHCRVAVPLEPGAALVTPQTRPGAQPCFRSKPASGCSSPFLLGDFELVRAALE